MPFLYSLLAILVLYLTYRRLILEFSRLIHRLGGSQNVLIWAWSLVFLPGTVIHEISHFLMAAATNARTGRIEIFPEFIEEALEEEEKRSIHLGYVQVQHLNPFQGFLVGLAPFVSGIAILIWLASLLPSAWETRSYTNLGIIVYFFFVVSNSFFPSWSDIRQVLPFIFLTLIVLILAWFFGFQFANLNFEAFQPLLNSLSAALAFSIVLNLIIIGILHLWK